MHPDEGVKITRGGRSHIQTLHVCEMPHCLLGKNFILLSSTYYPLLFDHTSWRLPQALPPHPRLEHATIAM